VAAAGGLKALWLAYFSQPAGERVLYRLARKRRVCRILEIGLGDGVRARRLLSLVQRYQPLEKIRYATIDLFESRPEHEPRMTLKAAHRLLRSTGVRAKLVPGDAYAALVRAANTISHVDLVIVSANQNEAALSRAWFYVPRMLAKNALVLQEHREGEQVTYREVPREDLIRRAKITSWRRAA
jgi:spermidine synthase